MINRQKKLFLLAAVLFTCGVIPMQAMATGSQSKNTSLYKNQLPINPKFENKKPGTLPRYQESAEGSIRDATPLPPFEIKSLHVKGVNGKSLELNFGLYYPESSVRQENVIIYWLNNRTREPESTLWQNRLGFNSSRGGFKSAVTVDLSGKDLDYGHIQAVIPACTPLPVCTKDIWVSKGDLEFGQLTIEHLYGSHNGSANFILELKNAGPAAFGECLVQLNVDGRMVKNWRFEKLRVDGTINLKWPFTQSFHNKPFEATILCDDLIKSNNTRRGTLRL